MGAETTATATVPPEVRLVAGPLARWPAALLEQLHQRGPLVMSQLESLPPAPDPAADGAGAGLLLLGYAEPRHALAALLAPEFCHDEPAPEATGSDPVALLRDWQQASEQLLQLRRQGGPGVLLVNLSRLDGPAQAALLRRLTVDATDEGNLSATSDRDAEATTAEDAQAAAPQPPPLPLPTVVAHYLAQRPEIDQLLADLEGCAELLGREPLLPTAAPAARGLVLAERLLGEWLESRAAHQEALAALRRDLELRQDELATTSGVLADVAGLQRQAEAEAERLRQELAEQSASREQALGEAEARHALEAERLRQELEQTRQTLEQARRQAAEEEARLRDGEEERELILLQLQQVQEELSHTFQELTQARRERQESLQSAQESEQARQELERVLQSRQQEGERLAALEQECRFLFLNSQLSPQIDRTKIATILQLVRDNLRV
ncbi:MAG: hypothetical protein VKJ05_03055 [Synechococcaceae cyanobacterium]|nr:hypothetical protein [Synechococcaceae cyanobacterium]